MVKDLHHSSHCAHVDSAAHVSSTTQAIVPKSSLKSPRSYRTQVHCYALVTISLRSLFIKFMFIIVTTSVFIIVMKKCFVRDSEAFKAPLIETQKKCLKPRLCSLFFLPVQIATVVSNNQDRAYYFVIALCQLKLKCFVVTLC